MTDNAVLAKQLFDATSSGDADTIRGLCADNFKGSQNGGPAMEVEALVGLSVVAKRALPDFRYGNAVRRDTGDGFVEEHDVLATLPDGSEFCLPVCVVGDVEGGKITALREYFDSHAAAALMKALRG